MNTTSAVTEKRSKIRLLTFTLPILMMGMLQVGGCMRSTPTPPPPGGTYLSQNGGVTFEQKVMLKESEVAGQNIARFTLGEAHRPFHDPTSIYIPAREQGIVVSKDNGATWKVVNTPLVFTVNIVVLPDDTWVVSGTGEDGQGYVVRSLNQGAEWEIVLTVPLPPQGRQLTFFQGGGSEASVVLSIAQDPFNKDRIYAGSNLGTIFVGERSAQAWRTLHTLTEENLMGMTSQQTSAVQKIIVSPNRPNDYLLLAGNGNLIRITDGVQTNLEVPLNLDEDDSFLTSNQTAKVHDAKFVPGFPDALLVGINNGVVLSRDAGSTWIKLPVPIDAVLDFSKVTVTTSPANPNRFFVSFNNVVYRSEDAGNTWITYSFGALGVPGWITDISIDPTNESNILVVTSPVSI